ncbi:hypothetical protein EY915_17525 [Citrobacter braakii]|uniref:hypothetical protein n=1 Tax=Citrobacter braakii TaxID=57706 RepID=UPI00103BEE29|nr:hypothetical protein [Citrobacter braakii]TCC78120.1 hypothetical protein EY915_17525 [Citrobacter braakii]
MSKTTGLHASLQRFIIRCDFKCIGIVPNGDFTVLHARSLDISGISCKSMIVQGGQFHQISNIDVSGDFQLKGSNLILTGLLPWGNGTNAGGSYWNNISRVRCGTTSSATSGKFIINIYAGSVNQNTMSQIVGVLQIIGQGSDSGINNYEGNANTFYGVDTSGSSGYLLDNQSVPAQHNMVLGLYGEVEGNGKIRGPWTILGARAQYGGWVSTMSHMNSVIGTYPTAGAQGGDSISLSGSNLCPSGDWSVLGPKGAPEDYSLLGIPSEAKIFLDNDEPGGCGRYFGVDIASVRCRLTINLTRSPTGFIRGAFFFKGDDPVEVVIEDQSGGNIIYMPVDKYSLISGLANGWKLYRVSAATLDKAKSYRMRITIDAGKTGKTGKLGCCYFSNYHASILPTFAGWSNSKFRSTGAPTVIETGVLPIGIECTRTSPFSLPSDPTCGWKWNGTAWLKINVSA